MYILICSLSRAIQPTGVCRHAANLAQCLSTLEQVDKITLIVGVWQKEYFLKSFNLNASKIKLISIPIKNNALARNFWFLYQLPQLIKQVNPDLVHVSYPIPIFRFLFSQPIITTIHDFYPYEKPENFGFPNVFFNQIFLEICLKNSHGIVSVSQFTLERFKYYYPTLYQKTKNCVIYNIVDFDFIHSQRPDLIDPQKPFILAIGQHRKNKNIDLLLQAYKKLIDYQQIHRETKLILVGSPGPETQDIMTMIDNKNLQNRVQLFAAITDSELRWLYENCLLFVCPSSHEGFCLPLAEALYFSCRIVCSDIPVLREVGDSACIYFKLEGDAIANLSTAITEALNQHHPKRNLNDFRFSKTNAARQYTEFYLNFI